MSGFLLDLALRLPLPPRFPSAHLLCQRPSFYYPLVISLVLAVAPVTLFFAHLLFLPHLLGYFLSHPFGCYYLLFISTRTVFFCPYLILLISSLSLSFFPSAFFLPAHLLSQPLIVIIPSLVTSFILAFCSFPFLLPGGPRRFIFSCLAHLSRFLFLSLRIFLPAHLLSQLFGCHYCLVISLRLSFRSFSFFIFRTISHLLISNFNYDAQLALSV